MAALQGIVCANITPFDESRNVDYKGVRKLARYLADSGIQAVYPLGTNGEGIACQACKGDRGRSGGRSIAVFLSPVG